MPTRPSRAKGRKSCRSARCTMGVCPCSGRMTAKASVAISQRVKAMVRGPSSAIAILVSTKLEPHRNATSRASRMVRRRRMRG